MLNRELGSVGLVDLPKKDTKKGRLLTYLTDNRIEGTRQVYSMPDFLKECGLTFRKLWEIHGFLNVLYNINFAGHRITGSVVPTVNANEEFLELYVDVFGWELLSLVYSNVPFPKKPSEKIKTLIAKIDQENNQEATNDN